MFLLSKMKRTRIGRRMPSWYLLAVRQLMTRKSGVLCAQRFRILPRSRYFRLHQICPCPQFKRRRGVLLACETTVFYRREFVDLFWFVNKKERWPSQLSFICIAVVPMQDVLFNVSGQIFLWTFSWTVKFLDGLQWYWRVMHTIRLAVEVAVFELALKWVKAIYRSWHLVLTRDLGLRWWSQTLPVLLNFVSAIVVSCWVNIHATYINEKWC